MVDGVASSVEGPGRRRESWSLRDIVENVAGRPIDDFQDPSRPVHPYLTIKPVRLPPRRPVDGPTHGDEGGEPDPVDRVYPPLVGSTGRTLHGPDHEHHDATLHSVRGETYLAEPGSRPHAPGPSRRPERIYLHYLLLHMDRLSDAALGYLKHAVDEEVTQRHPTPEPASTPSPAA
ncbi:MAG: hypothetical protein L3K17_01525 [Thermoplasmata archaeon]|nr:hypothetical protein [Thermoplasmata archaeon]